MNKQDFDKAVDDLWRMTAWGDHVALNKGLALISAEWDAARMPTADAAQFLYLSGIMHPSDLRASSGGFIRNTAYFGGLGLRMADMIAAGYVANGYISVPCGTGHILVTPPPAISTVKKIPFRHEGTADAALYLYMNFATSEAWLRKAPSKSIRLDAGDIRKAMDARKVKVFVTVMRLGSPESADYIHLKFFKGTKLVGEALINGYSEGPYVRIVELTGDYDSYRQECSVNAVFRVERVTA
jgi:hypothetical protein